MKTVLIAYKSGNIRSVQFALERLGCNAVLSSDPEEIRSADKIIFPGVGEAASAMEQLKSKKLEQLIPELKQPFLGICLGMQLMCTHSEEGDTKGLGIFPVEVKKFSSPDPNSFKIPQMGWNTISKFKGPLFNGIPDESFVYYVHSYYAAICNETAAVTDYIQPFSAALMKNNFYGVQFHPEKSGTVGESIIRNFLQL